LFKVRTKISMGRIDSKIFFGCKSVNLSWNKRKSLLCSWHPASALWAKIQGFEKGVEKSRIFSLLVEVNEQGDPIGRIFAKLAINYIHWAISIAEVAKKFGYFLHRKRLTNMDWAIFFASSSGHPVYELCF
jgi:hypothetical protein